jgi:pimeloyl-ACP methyl ester carboxylesterase
VLKWVGIRTLIMVLHFVLIHGGCHGAWAWYKLQHRLQEKGCRVTAMDMRSAGADPKTPSPELKHYH